MYTGFRYAHDHSYGLTVKLRPCQCSCSSPAGRIAAACLCGHFKCNLLLAQARPRMIQHLSSTTCCDSGTLSDTTYIDTELEWAAD